MTWARRSNSLLKNVVWMLSKVIRSHEYFKVNWRNLSSLQRRIEWKTQWLSAWLHPMDDFSNFWIEKLISFSLLSRAFWSLMLLNRETSSRPYFVPYAAKVDKAKGLSSEYVSIRVNASLNSFSPFIACASKGILILNWRFSLRLHPSPHDFSAFIGIRRTFQVRRKEFASRTFKRIIIRNAQ